MAMQIMMAKIKGKNIYYSDDYKEVNVTDFLRPICDDFFEEETVLEEGEEIYVEVVRLDKIPLLSERIENELFSLLEKVEKTNGIAAKKEIIVDIKDLIRFRTLIISGIAEGSGESVLTIS